MRRCTWNARGSACVRHGSSARLTPPRLCILINITAYMHKYFQLGIHEMRKKIIEAKPGAGIRITPFSKFLETHQR
jgi:hypothetical protein